MNDDRSCFAIDYWEVPYLFAIAMISQVPAQARSIVFTIPDMMCGSCEKKIIAAVTVFDPAAVVTADLETKGVTILTRCEEGLLREAIEQVGFEVVM